MKKAKFYFTIGLLMVLTYNVGCGKKESKPEVYHVEQYIKDWMFFDTGSWWVYKEINSGIIDSQYVIKSGFNNIETDPKKKGSYFKDQMGIVNINTGWYYFLASPRGGSNIEKRRETGTELGSTYLVFKELFIGGYPPGSNTKITNIDNNYQLDNLKDTLITLLDRLDESEKGDSVQYQVFKGVGIINKKNITRKQEWKLIKYQINLNRQ